MPQEQLSFWNNELVSENACSLSGLSRKIMQHSIHFHNKGYMGHQVAVTLPLTALTNAPIGYMNNCTTVYELGMVGNAMEKVVLSHLAEKYGYDKQATGFITSGVSEKDYHKQAIMVSEEAHYSVERVAKIMGIQSDCIIKVPTGEDFSIRVNIPRIRVHRYSIEIHQSGEGIRFVTYTRDRSAFHTNRPETKDEIHT